MNYVILILLIAIAIYNIYLSLTKQNTLSQQYQRLFPAWLDVIILVGILTGLCFLSTVHIALRIWIAGICGHVCWSNKERYE